MKTIYPVPPDLWDEIAASAPNATFFHTRTWMQILCSSFPGIRDATRAYELKGGLALLPLADTPGRVKGMLRRYDSLPAGTYGGLISTGSVLPEECEQIYREALGPLRVTSIKVTTGPFAPSALPAAAACQDSLTQVLDLEPGFEALARAFSRGNKSSINKAARAGLCVEPASTDGDYAAYFDAYQDTLRRWGSNALSNYPRRLFDAIRTMAGESARLWLVKGDGRTLGGILNLHHKDAVYYWHAAWHEADFDVRPANFAHAEVIRRACEEGYRWYDFGPSGPNEGVVQFKRGFAPAEVAIQRAYVIDPRWAWFEKL